MKKFRIVHLETFIFLVVKFTIYLNRLVLVMPFVKLLIDTDLVSPVIILAASYCICRRNFSFAAIPNY